MWGARSGCAGYGMWRERAEGAWNGVLGRLRGLVGQMGRERARSAVRGVFEGFLRGRGLWLKRGEAGVRVGLLPGGGGRGGGLTGGFSWAWSEGLGWQGWDDGGGSVRGSGLFLCGASGCLLLCVEFVGFACVGGVCGFRAVVSVRLEVVFGIVCEAAFFDGDCELALVVRPDAGVLESHGAREGHGMLDGGALFGPLCGGSWLWVLLRRRWGRCWSLWCWVVRRDGGDGSWLG